MDRANEANTTHGAAPRGRKTPEYRTWAHMIGRCEDPGDQAFKNYGARGIRVCARWRNDFAAFLADMGPRPSSEYSIDRRNNDLGYEPLNCHWATDLEQGQNRRSVRLLEWRGEIHCIKEWSRILGIKYLTLYMRLKAGWTIDEAMGTPLLRVSP